jgi:hypothetical protein
MAITHSPAAATAHIAGKAVTGGVRGGILGGLAGFVTGAIGGALTSLANPLAWLGGAIAIGIGYFGGETSAILVAALAVPAVHALAGAATGVGIGAGLGLGAGIGLGATRGAAQISADDQRAALIEKKGRNAQENSVNAQVTQRLGQEVTAAYLQGSQETEARIYNQMMAAQMMMQAQQAPAAAVQQAGEIACRAEAVCEVKEPKSDKLNPDRFRKLADGHAQAAVEGAAAAATAVHTV